MFDIKIGTVLMGGHALDPDMLSALAPFGFEGYEISCDRYFRTHDIADYAAQLTDVLKGIPVSTLGCYNNPLTDPDALADLTHIMDNAHLFHCDTISVFAGEVPGCTVSESMAVFKKVFSELCARAEDKGLKIAIENCSNAGWSTREHHNIGYGPDAWELMFDAVPNECLGLEWEPSHQMHQLIDPISQLRRWAGRVRHVHGKDATIAWDVLREHGTRGKERWCWDRTPGFGDTNWNDVCTILMQNGYRGFISIEGYHDPVHYDDLEWSAQLRSLTYLKDCRGGQTFIEGPAYKGFQPPRKHL